MKLWKWVLAGQSSGGPSVLDSNPSSNHHNEHPLRVPGRTVFVGDDEFLVREMGADEGVPILLIHGLAGSSLTEWYQVAPKLAVDRRVILIDHRGHGLSAPGDRRFEVEDDLDDIAGVLDNLGVAEVDLVGYSMGGIIAQAFAQRHPGRVRKLVLIAGIRLTFGHVSAGSTCRGGPRPSLGASDRDWNARGAERLSDCQASSETSARQMDLAGHAASQRRERCTSDLRVTALRLPGLGRQARSSDDGDRPHRRLPGATAVAVRTGCLDPRCPVDRDPRRRS